MFRLENKVLRDVMTRGVVTVQMDATVKHISKLLSGCGVSAVAVVGHEGETMGIVSDMDILKIIGKENWENYRAESIMSSKVESVKATSTLCDAARIMKQKHIHRLLILSEQGVGASQRPVAILSASDIVREAARD